MKEAGFDDERNVGLHRQSGVKVNTEALGGLGEMHSSISQLKICRSDGSSLLFCTDDKSFSLPTVELQPVFSHPFLMSKKQMGIESKSSSMSLGLALF